MSEVEISAFRKRRMIEAQKKAMKKIKRNLKAKGMLDAIDLDAFESKLSERFHSKELELLSQIEEDKNNEHN